VVAAGKPLPRRAVAVRSVAWAVARASGDAAAAVARADREAGNHDRLANSKIFAARLIHFTRRLGRPPILRAGS